MSMASGSSKKNDPNTPIAKWAESRHLNEKITKNPPKSNTKDRRTSASKSVSSTSNEILLPGSTRSDMPSTNERLLSATATLPSSKSKLLPGTKQSFLPTTENSLLSSQNEAMLPGSCKSLPSTSRRKGSGLDADRDINAIPTSKSYQTQQDIVQNSASKKSPTKVSAGGAKDKKKKVSKPLAYESVEEELEATIGQDNKSFDSSEASKQESWSLELLNNSITALKEAANREDHVSIDFSNLNDITPDSAAYAPLKSYQQRHVLKHSFPSAPYQRIDHPADQNLCSSFITSILYLLCALIVFCPIMAIIIICVPISGLIKKICGCCCCCAKERACICCCSLHLSDLELLWLHSSPLNAAVSQSLIVLERGLSTFKVRELVHSRLITAENKRGHRLYPRFTQKIASFFSGYSWIWDNDFIVENHVFSMPSSIKNEEELQDYISEMASKQLPSDRPMWEIHVLQNYGVARDTILLFRIHPCVTDGITMVRILFSSIVDNQPPFKLKPRFARKSLFLNSFRAFFMGPIVFLSKWIFTSRDFNFLHGDHVHLSGKKVVSWSEFYSLSKVTRIKQVTRSTFNDVLLSVAVGCIRSYLQVSGIANPFNMQCCIPVDVSKDSGDVKMGSRYILVPVPLPTNTEGSIPQLWETKHLMELMKCSSDVISLNAALHVTSTILPEILSKKIWSSVYNKCTCMISNLPGPENSLSFGSKEIKSIVYWLPAVDQMALSISFFTYADQVRMAVIADRSVLPNPELITRDFNFQLEKLSQLLAHRRIPGEHINRRIEAMHQQGNEVQAEPTVEQLQVKMSLVQQQLHDLKMQLDIVMVDKRSEYESRVKQRIELLKEEFRDLLLELRRRRSVDGTAVLLSDEEDEEEAESRRPYRRRAMSTTSRRSTVSISSTVRPLAASPSSHQPPTPPSIHSPFAPTSHISSRSQSPDLSSRTMSRASVGGGSYSPHVERRF